MSNEKDETPIVNKNSPYRIVVECLRRRTSYNIQLSSLNIQSLKLALARGIV